MNKNTRILFGITTKSHIEIALDEMYGLQDMGYTCSCFEYGGKKNINSAFARLVILIYNAFRLMIKTYQFKPDYIYLNSRVELTGSLRDFITIVILKLFYYKEICIVLKSHGSNLEALQNNSFLYKKLIFPFLKNQVRAWLFLSTEEVEFITANNLLDHQKIFLSKNIVRVNKFKIDEEFKAKHNIPSDYKILLFAGRIVKEKGLDHVVEAFAEIKKLFKVVLIIVGDGDAFALIKKNIENLSLKNDIIITGWVDETTSTYFTSNSDVLIYPTFAPEGLPMSLFNSLAAGLSVITTPIRAANDYLEEPKNCLWVAPRSSTSIIIALKKLLSNEPLMKQMQINNKLKAQLFAQVIVCKELSSILNSINENKCDENLRVVREIVA